MQFIPLALLLAAALASAPGIATAKQAPAGASATGFVHTAGDVKKGKKAKAPKGPGKKASPRSK